MTAQYVVGIDLGTTNSVLSYASLGEEQPAIQLLSIPQLVAAGTVESRTMLPSFLYLGTESEGRSGAFGLPWQPESAWAAGELARRQSAEVPQRVVGAAKSWLAYSRVDRHQPILPWNAPREVSKISPVAASEHYLAHMIGAWESAFPDAPIGNQVVVLTVPASFDASGANSRMRLPWPPACRKVWYCSRNRRPPFTLGWPPWASGGGES